MPTPIASRAVRMGLPIRDKCTRHAIRLIWGQHQTPTTLRRMSVSTPQSDHGSAAAFPPKSRSGNVALQRVRQSGRAMTRMHFRANASCGARVRKNHICHAASLLGPRCESGLCYFGDDLDFPLFARLWRLARANGPKSRRIQTARGSLGGISVAKSRTVGVNSAPQRPTGRRLNLPGWGAGIRTPEWRYQKPLPYHLATPQCRERAESYAIRARKATAGSDPVLTQFWRFPAAGSGWFAASFPALRAKRKAAIGPAPSEYSSAW